MIAVRAAAMVGDLDSPERARAALARITPVDGGLGSTTITVAGAIAYSLGFADEALGRTESAVEHFRRALVVDARMAAPVQGAVARVALAARQEEVLHLVTEGLPNWQIADRLALSERTVETHVRHILGKLDLDRREDAIAWSLRR